MSDFKLKSENPKVGHFGGSASGRFSGYVSESVVLDTISKKTNLLQLKKSAIGNGGNFVGGNVESPVKVTISAYELFQGDELLESQVAIAVVSQILRDDRQMYLKLQSLDWLNNILDASKTNFLIEIQALVSDIMSVKYDLVNHYSESLKQFVGVLGSELNPTTKGYNLNIAMYFKLIKTGLITIDPMDNGYINGQKLLHSAYDGKAESISRVCENSGDKKSLCVVQYIKDILSKSQMTTKPTDNKLRGLTSSNLEFVALSFSTKKGYQNIYSLIYSYLIK